MLYLIYYFSDQYLRNTTFFFLSQPVGNIIGPYNVSVMKWLQLPIFVCFKFSVRLKKIVFLYTEFHFVLLPFF